MSSERDSFDLSPQQYHAGLDRLWSALAVSLGVSGVQDDDVFTLCASAITKLKADNDCLRHERDDIGMMLRRVVCRLGDDEPIKSTAKDFISRKCPGSILRGRDDGE